ncbi:LytTR family DNA-binding domain-containing protein [Hymenobacter sp. 15J16-1T3B]|uniref:LytR/AlgR family response regulator transcription factor n=1 Tax=Hymenobacter sp. 15J16-1T3B TaxID=2886941 RepID=UPI001D117650|nr:LytTR family DNA-binding domain-containing protein [Hymenobacter sp. 15J16-1T3B]MCC3159191.1 LytTR family DNA-binding domain-containing protein [Hymenobacter sp. 15J16-1T3B]
MPNSTTPTVLRCLVVDDDPLAIQVIQNCITHTDFLEPVGACSSAIEAAATLRTTPVDLLFLDVDMPEMSGLDLLDTLTEPPLVVLVTSSRDHAVAAFEHRVVDYLVKPVAYARFLKAAQKAFETAQAAPTPAPAASPVSTDHTFVKVDSKLVRVGFDEVHYVEALGDYVHIVLGQQKLIVYSTMRAVEEKFPAQQFVRIHRSTIVNLRYVQAIDDNAVVIDGKHLPIGQTYLRDVLQRLNKF